MLVWMAMLTGVAYPLAMTAIAQIAMHDKANGSMVVQNGKAVGSTLIAQKFSETKYFWPRPSAVNYDLLPSGGSNLGPTSRALAVEVAERRSFFSNPNVPSDLLFASGSGLDPHISIAAAYFQMGRVALVRNISVTKVKELIDSSEEGGILGPSCVNVLRLNLALDSL